ncbi:hypothetical protein CBS101457_000798 [Exobasidium rhododendri]|nr:hypothetical protein CBS101457_000798 [Exobasidium rhododendri]
MALQIRRDCCSLICKRFLDKGSNDHRSLYVAWRFSKDGNHNAIGRAIIDGMKREGKAFFTPSTGINNILKKGRSSAEELDIAKTHTVFTSRPLQDVRSVGEAEMQDAAHGDHSSANPVEEETSRVQEHSQKEKTIVVPAQKEDGGMYETLQDEVVDFDSIAREMSGGLNQGRVTLPEGTDHANTPNAGNRSVHRIEETVPPVERFPNVSLHHKKMGKETGSEAYFGRAVEQAKNETLERVKADTDAIKKEMAEMEKSYVFLSERVIDCKSTFERYADLLAKASAETSEIVLRMREADRKYKQLRSNLIAVSSDMKNLRDDAESRADSCRLSGYDLERNAKVLREAHTDAARKASELDIFIQKNSGYLESSRTRLAAIDEPQASRRAGASEAIPSTTSGGREGADGVQLPKEANLPLPSPDYGEQEVPRDAPPALEQDARRTSSDSRNFKPTSLYDLPPRTANQSHASTAKEASGSSKGHEEGTSRNTCSFQEPGKSPFLPKEGKRKRSFPEDPIFTPISDSDEEEVSHKRRTHVE